MLDRPGICTEVRGNNNLSKAGSRHRRVFHYFSAWSWELTLLYPVGPLQQHSPSCLHKFLTIIGQGHSSPIQISWWKVPKRPLKTNEKRLESKDRGRWWSEELGQALKNTSVHVGSVMSPWHWGVASVWGSGVESRIWDGSQLLLVWL